MISSSTVRPRQKIIVWLAVLLIAGMGLYPPWVSVRGLARFRTPAGYHWLFSPPSADPIELDVARLLVQWLLVIVCSAALGWAWPSVHMPSWWPKAAQKSSIIKQIGGCALLLGGLWIAIWVAIRMSPVVAPMARSVKTTMDQHPWITGTIAGIVLIFLFGWDAVSKYRRERKQDGTAQRGHQPQQ